MGQESVTKTAVSATLHCLTGCAIGEVLGMIIGTAAGFSNGVTIMLAIALAFLFGYLLSLLPLLKAGLPLSKAMRLVLAADTLSILTMEIVDNIVIWFVPGAMDAGLDTFLFWATLALALAVAFCAALPVNRYLLLRGQGHALVHKYHHGQHEHAGHDTHHKH